MPKLSLSELLQRANQRLKAQNFGPRIEARGSRLVLRATFPPRPNSKKGHAHQQRLTTGLLANPDGIGQAEKLAKAVDVALGNGTFQWGDYIQSSTPETVGDWIAQFEIEYFRRRERNAKSETTWQKDYASVFSKLPSGDKISEILLKQTIEETTDPDTRTRKRQVLAYSQLAHTAGLNCDFKWLGGKYGPKTVQPQDVPSDESLILTWRSVPDPSWKWAIGVLAAYGIRPSELTYCSVGENGICTVWDGKTGSRRCWPLFPEWVEQFVLKDQKMPRITGRNNSDLGHRVNQYLRRIDSPFTAKAPRKAWAVRAILLGLPVELAAAQQGHSVKVHCELYARWISDESQQRAYDAIMNRPNRPIPPAI